MAVDALHLHTYFLFPFSVDMEAVTEDHADIWQPFGYWIDGLDAWIAAHASDSASRVVSMLGGWQRDPYRRFDFNSPAYQDMVFFHPVVRRVFFDTGESYSQLEEREALLRCYSMSTTKGGGKVFLAAEDAKGRNARLEVTDLRLFLFANGIGILSIGVEGGRLAFEQVLWINEMVRKVYPSSGRQVREGRVPCRIAVERESAGTVEVISEERFEHCVMIDYQPPLSKTIRDLLYFADYDNQEFEPVLDERMIVYTYVALDPESLPPGFIHDEEYDVLMSRLLYVDRTGEGYRYEPDFTRAQMADQVYRRWAHQGTLYGFTSYSNVTMTLGTFECGEHQLREGFLVHRMFNTRYYLTILAALFYRATLLDFSERSALVSRRLFRKYLSGEVSEADMQLADQLLAQFQFFANYWLFGELANKDEEIEHFQMQCAQYRLDAMKHELEVEIEKLTEGASKFYQLRNTDAINRLAMLSIVLGGGAMITGFFGMNFGRGFEKWFFNPETGTAWLHQVSIIAVSVLCLSALIFGIYLVAANWNDYRSILMPGRVREASRRESLRRSTLASYEDDEAE